MTRYDLSVQARGVFVELANPDSFTESYATRTAERLDAVLTLLAGRPLIGRPLRGETRRFAVNGTPYSVLYRPTEFGIYVIRIHHHAQRPPANWSL